MKLEKMFMLDAFMFRFESEPGQPQNENHKIIFTARASRFLGREKIVQLVRKFLSLKDIQWTRSNALETGIGAIYNPKDYEDQVAISPTIIVHKGIARKVVWVLMRQDVMEINGVADDGNNYVKVML